MTDSFPVSVIFSGAGGACSVVDAVWSGGGGPACPGGGRGRYPGGRRGGGGGPHQEDHPKSVLHPKLPATSTC